MPDLELLPEPSVAPLLEDQVVPQPSLSTFDAPVSRALHSALKAAAPALFAPLSESHLRLLAYLLFTSFRDADTGNPVLSRVVLASLTNEMKRLETGRFRSQAVLAEFQKISGFTLQVTPWRYTQHQATTVHLLLPASVSAAYHQQLETGSHDLFLVSGTPSTAREHALRSRQQDEAHLQGHPIDERRPNAPILRYLRSVRPHIYAQYGRRVPQARQFVLTQYASHPGDSAARQEHLRLKREGQLRLLNALQWSFPPHYKQVENTERIYTAGASVANVTREVRKILFHNTVSYDLRNAHLAIAAKLWGLTSLTALLEREGSIWPHLLAELDLDAAHKDALKPILYSTVYGMAQPALKAQITRTFDKQVTQKYFSTSLSGAIVEARNERMQRISDDGGIQDAFGQVHPLAVQKDLPRGTQKRQVRSLLSREVSSYEVKVMLSAVDVATRTDKFRIVLWLHDGILVRYTDRTQQARWDHQLRAAVDAAAQHHGFATRLEVGG
ncbi:hypothetical protein [Deinococcus ficus]|uniref:hypothetical protein n=1 Tax=Deinococcus ficus TaxID=317577 RepID=UPI0012DCA284|nr:hypothetical protein [Deinococcus ficus]